MTNLTRWSPFKNLEQTSPFEDFFRSFALRPRWVDLETPEMRIDVTENDRSYSVKAEMPGVNKDDIDISIEGSQVSIVAEVKRETKAKDDEREICTERYYGRVYRSFGLPGEVDSGKASAHYDKGVLSLILPKKQNGNSRKLTIS